MKRKTLLSSQERDSNQTSPGRFRESELLVDLVRVETLRQQSGRPVPVPRSSGHDDDDDELAAAAERLLRFLLCVLHSRQNCWLGITRRPVPSGPPSHVPPSRRRDERWAPGVSTPPAADGHVLGGVSCHGHQHHGLEEHLSGRHQPRQS